MYADGILAGSLPWSLTPSWTSSPQSCGRAFAVAHQSAPVICQGSPYRGRRHQRRAGVSPCQKNPPPADPQGGGPGCPGDAGGAGSHSAALMECTPQPRARGATGEPGCTGLSRPALRGSRRPRSLGKVERRDGGRGGVAQAA